MFEINKNQQELIADTCELCGIKPERFVLEAIENHIEKVTREYRKKNGAVDWDLGMVAIESMLTRKGYEIIDRDFEGFDLVLSDSKGVIAFAKVAMVNGDMPEDDITELRHDFEHAAIHFFGENEVDNATQARCDSITLATNDGSRAMVRHHIDAINDKAA